MTDFRPLTESDILGWLSRTSWWPGGMDLNIDANALGLTPEDLRAEQNIANAERRRREQERRSIIIDGVQMSANKADFRAIIDHVNQTPSHDFLNVVLGGTEGSDFLGYDFIVKRSSDELFYEVKATSGDTLELELGETEVALASRLARTNRYRILFVRNVLDSSRRTIHMLPNPLSPRGSRLFRSLGRGLRYQFSLA